MLQISGFNVFNEKTFKGSGVEVLGFNNLSKLKQRTFQVFGICKNVEPIVQNSRVLKFLENKASMFERSLDQKNEF